MYRPYRKIFKRKENMKMKKLQKSYTGGGK